MGPKDCMVVSDDVNVATLHIIILMPGWRVRVWGGIAVGSLLPPPRSWGWGSAPTMRVFTQRWLFVNHLWGGRDGVNLVQVTINKTARLRRPRESPGRRPTRMLSWTFTVKMKQPHNFFLLLHKTSQRCMLTQIVQRQILGVTFVRTHDMSSHTFEGRRLISSSLLLNLWSMRS